MIGRILTYIMFGCMTIALVLSFVGIREIYLGDGFRNWLQYVTLSLSNWSLEIPKIPDIPYLDVSTNIVRSIKRVVTAPVVGVGGGILANLKNVLNVIIFFFNFLIKLLNLIITLLNVLISVIQFVLTMVWCIKDIPNYLDSNNWLRWNGESSIWWWPRVGQ